ncbi:MAG: DNA alkylation repair protein [Microthrixaceae bacterium]
MADPTSTSTPPPEGTSTAFKDHIDAALVDRLAVALSTVDATFDASGFRRTATDGLDELELKGRISHVAEALHRSLPDDMVDAAAVIDGVLALDPEGDDGAPGGLTGWDVWPIAEWVALAGRGDPGVALELLSRITRYASGEFAIRPFIDDDPEAVMVRLSGWFERDDEHVRRLVSEGTRPRLPWVPRLAVAEADPTFAVGLLDRLVDDPSEYVRRSVSNHLNDLCKVAADDTRRIAAEWSDRAEVAAAAGDAERAEQIRWVLRRGLRTLVKGGDPEVFRLLGHDPDVALRVGLELGTPAVDLGGAAEWTLRIESLEAEPHRIVVDYGIGFLRADGIPGRKVFKWTTRDLAPGETLVLERRHKITPVSIRTYRSGTHPLWVQINGREVAETTFELSAD